MKTLLQDLANSPAFLLTKTYLPQGRCIMMQADNIGASAWLHRKVVANVLHTGYDPQLPSHTEDQSVACPTGDPDPPQEPL